jgi:oligopeptide/dipeptide ABC transporter ATP-binding protein
LSAVPLPDPDLDYDPIRLPGEIPNPLAAPPGCRFHTRCPFAQPRCAAEVPDWREIAPGHSVACHFADTFDFTRRERQEAEALAAGG